MDESEIISNSFNSREFIGLVIFAAACAAFYLAYRSYLNKSLKIQEAVALAQIEGTVTHQHNVPITTMNGHVHTEPTPAQPKVPVIKDTETGAIIESTEGPTIKENRDAE